MRAALSRIAEIKWPYWCHVRVFLNIWDFSWIYITLATQSDGWYLSFIYSGLRVYFPAAYLGWISEILRVLCAGSFICLHILPVLSFTLLLTPDCYSRAVKAIHILLLKFIRNKHLLQFRRPITQTWVREVTIFGNGCPAVLITAQTHARLFPYQWDAQFSASRHGIWCSELIHFNWLISIHDE